MTPAASIEKPAGVPITKLPLALELSRVAHKHCETHNVRCPHDIGLVLEPVASRFVREAVNDALDKIVQAGCRFASRGAQRIAELAQSMKHKELAR